jgi:catechol 2,3-dioxygenase-like lactoylglutathione lyase family enzyme
MLGDHEATATVAVRSLKAARRFYEDTLGFKVLHTEGDGAVSYEAGKGELLVYQSEFAGTSKATVATWTVPDVESVVRDLAAKGIRFEHYELPKTTRKGDVHLAGHLKLAWFKDPDGNIHALVGVS